MIPSNAGLLILKPRRDRTIAKEAVERGFQVEHPRNWGPGKSDALDAYAAVLNGRKK